MATLEFQIVDKYPNLARHSRYRGVDIFQDEGRIFFAHRRPNILEQNPQDIFHQVSRDEDGRIDIIAYRYYQNPRLWWLIADANDIFDPFKEVSVGTILRIPSSNTYFESYLSAFGGRRT